MSTIGAAVPTSIKSLPFFDDLTEAEALVFEREAESRGFDAGQEISLQDAVLLIDEGSVKLESSSGHLGSMGPGSFLGETSLFDLNPVSLLAAAETETSCLVWSHESLKNAFRYGRTGAVKIMVAFTRSLATKLRAANQLVQTAPATSGSGARSSAQLDAVDRQRLASLLVPREFAADSVIFEQGSAGNELFIIGEGEVEILKKTEEGDSLTLAELGPGDFFGEMAFVDQSPRSAAAVARTPLKVHVLPSGSLERIVEYNVGTALYLTSLLCKILARRLNATLSRIAPP